MSKKERKEALKFILNNEVILRKISTALGCDKKMSLKERKVIVKDMIETYREESNTDSFSVNIFGPGKKSNTIFGRQPDFRNPSYDDIAEFDMTSDDRDMIENNVLNRIMRRK